MQDPTATANYNIVYHSVAGVGAAQDRYCASLGVGLIRAIRLYRTPGIAQDGMGWTHAACPALDSETRVDILDNALVPNEDPGTGALDWSDILDVNDTRQSMCSVYDPTADLALDASKALPAIEAWATALGGTIRIG